MISSRYDQLDKTVEEIGGADLPSPLTSMRSTGIYTRQSKSGGLLTELVWPSPRERQHEDVHNITEWRNFPNLWRPFAETALILNGGVSSRSRAAVIGDLNTGWWNFLRVTKRQEITLSQFSNSLFSEFKSWLQSDRGENIFWAHGTCRKRFRRPIAIVEHLQLEEVQLPYPSYGLACDQTPVQDQIKQFHIVPGGWRGSYKSGVPTKVISRPQFSKLLASAATEIHQTIRDIEYATFAIRLKRSAAKRIVEKEGYIKNEYADLATVLAVLDHRYQGILPSVSTILEDDKTLWFNICKKHGGLRRMEAFFYPTLSKLIPFIIWLEAALAANPDILLAAELDHFSIEKVMNTERFVWRAHKKRSHKIVTRSFPVSDDPLHPMKIVDFLVAWSKRLRLATKPYDRNRLFLCVARMEKKQEGIGMIATSAGNETMRSTFRIEMRKFFARNDIPDHVQLKQIRTTVLDIVDELSGGDIRAVAKIGNHSSIDITNQHYTSDSARSRDCQSLALVQHARERWVGTAGKIDPRGEPQSSDNLAATPGWTCLDPFDSPIAGIEKNKLCTAYGRCPICPHASINTNSSYSYLRLRQLEQAIHDSMSCIALERWSTIWRPCLESIVNRWLPAFEKQEVVSAANQIKLPALPPIE